MRLVYFFMLTHFVVFSQISTKVDSTNVLIGDQINFTISATLKNPSSFNEFSDTVGKFEIIDKSIIDTIQNDSLWILQQKYVLSIWDSGTFYIPALKMESFTSDSIEVYCNTIQTNINEDFKDIKEPINLSITFMEILPFLIAFLILILLLFLIRYLLKNKSEKPITKVVQKEILLPYQIALNELQKLKDENLLKKELVKDYHIKLSEIVRRYIEDGIGFQAMELTTNEILNELKQRKIETNKISEFFKISDLAKFAKLKPLEIENKECMDIAIEFVKNTKPKNDELQ